MTRFLSHIHAELRNARLTRRGATHRAEDVPRGTHKRYPRMEQVALPEPDAITATLSDVLARRHSTDSQSTPLPLSLQDIGTMFGLALRKHAADDKRPYPSGGSLYPIETYLIAPNIVDGLSGVFHYNPSTHALEKLWDVPRDFVLKDLAKKPDWLMPSALIIFTSVWKRSSAKYGELAYQHALLEAGHMSENMLLVAEAIPLGVRPYAGFDDIRIAQLLDLDESDEQTVHSIVVSKTRRASDHARTNSRAV